MSQSLIEKAVERIESLQQALWDVYGILGFDQDGDDTPLALAHPTIETLVRDAAREYRADTEVDAALLDAENGELRRENEALRKQLAAWGPDR